jgi:hypothetical protein
MSKRFLTNVNLEKNELQNVVIHKLATAPAAPVEGQLYYNTTDDLFYIYQSSSWKNITGRLDDIIAADTYILLTDNGDGTIELDIASATESKQGLMTAADKAKLNNATALNTAGTIVQRGAGGEFAAGAINVTSVVINETISGVTPANHAVTKGYVDALVQSGVNIIGGIDCSTNPDYPAASAGDAYYVTVAGKIGGASGEAVSAGDLIVAVVDSLGGDEATVGDDWIVMERNIEYATETTPGYIQIATQVEVDAGVDDTKAVTPLKLASVIAELDAAGTFGADVGLGDTTKIFVVNHGLDKTDVHVQIKDTSSLELVEADVVITDSNNVTVSFNKAPALDEFRVVVQG